VLTAFAVANEVGYHAVCEQDTLSGNEMQKVLALALALALKAPGARTGVRISILLTALLLTACAEFPGVYKIDIEQGDVITQEMVDQLRPGMTKRQVRFIMGTPLVEDTFNQRRWDYVYSYQPGGEDREQKRLTILFDDQGRMESTTGDYAPMASSEPAAD
jgi:outer membrane protein assembly factor BamE (lipoprotein component of BamABCDE complex)